jgi:hypothetical protein
MKKIVLSMAMIIISMGVSLANPNPTYVQQCSQPGWYTYLWSNFGNSVSVEITSAHNFDTTINFVGFDTTTTTFKILNGDYGDQVHFHFKDLDGKESGEAEVKLKAPPCVNLPILLETFSGKYISPNEVRFKWTVTMEHNADRYEVWQSLPDSTDRKVATYASLGDTQTPRTYEVLVGYQSGNLNGSLQACFSCIGLLGLSLTYFRKRKLVIPMISLIFVTAGVFTSCSKENANIKPVKSTGIYRLKEVDKDGVVSNFNYIEVTSNQ